MPHKKHKLSDSTNCEFYFMIQLDTGNGANATVTSYTELLKTYFGI